MKPRYVDAKFYLLRFFFSSLQSVMDIEQTQELTLG
jgi:hypothetical protein